MVKGSVQEKNGYLHTVITYQDKDGKRRQKWQATGLAVQGNRRKAGALLREFIAEYYNQEELNKLFSVIHDELREGPIILAAYYGLRRSEVLGIKWSAIDWSEKTLSIHHTVCKTIVDGQDVIVRKDTMKNKTSFRTMPLLAEIETLLLETKKRQEANRRKCRKAYCKDYLYYVCVDNTGILLRPDYLTQHFQVILKKNNLKHIRFHDLRHSCASLLLANGVSLKEI